MSENLRAGYQQTVEIESTQLGNKVRALQKRFGGNGNPVFLKTRADNRLYRGAMVCSVVGLALTGVFMGMMATGTMPKKERPE